MSKDHGSYEKVPRRPLTSQEATWLRELVLANPQWADGGWQADREALAVVFDFGGAAPFGVKGACFDFFHTLPQSHQIVSIPPTSSNLSTSITLIRIRASPFE